MVGSNITTRPPCTKNRHHRFLTVLDHTAKAFQSLITNVLRCHAPLFDICDIVSASVVFPVGFFFHRMSLVCFRFIDRTLNDKNVLCFGASVLFDVAQYIVTVIIDKGHGLSFHRLGIVKSLASLTMV